MNLPKPYRECGCRDETGKRLRWACPKLGTVKGHGAWYVRYEAPRGANGRRRQPVLGPFQTEKQAQSQADRGTGPPRA